MLPCIHLALLIAGLTIFSESALAKPCEQEQRRARVLQAQNTHELEDQFAHFAKMQDESICMAILEHFDNLAMKGLGKILNVEEKARYIDYTGFVVSQMVKTYHASELSSETVRDRLDELIRHYPRTQQ